METIRGARPDRHRMLETARRIAFPRYPGSPGDLRAIELIAGWLRATGLETREQWFTYDIRPAFRALRALLVASALLLGFAGVAAVTSPWLAGLALVTAVVGAGSLLSWQPWLERLYRAPGPTRTANVVARQSSDEPRVTLILVAHHDSKSQNLSLPLRLGFTLTAVAAAVALGFVLGVAMLRSGPVWPPWIAPALGGVAAISLAALSTLRNGNESPGGVDNAGSIGILLELARLLPPRVPQDVELVFLSPGAEEDHMVGAIRWLDQHVAGLSGRPVWALNLDGAGIPGRATVIDRYGFGRRFSAHLSRTARAAARRLGISLRGVVSPPAMGVDAIPFAHRGLPCLTLTSGSLCPASLSVHSSRDRWEHLDGETLERVAQLALEIAGDLVGPGWRRLKSGTASDRRPCG